MQLSAAASARGAPSQAVACAAGEATQRRLRGAWPWPLSGLLLLLVLPMAALTLAMALLALAEPQTLDYGEPIVYGQASRLLDGQPLYQPLDQPPYTVTAYTPLYYAAAAALQATLGPGFGPGRGLSLLAGLVSAALVARLAAVPASTQTGVLAGALAAGLFLGLGFPGPMPWLGLYRVDLLGVALSLGAIALLAHAHGRQSALAAGVLAGLALLDKQTFFAALLAGSLWLWTVDRQSAVRFAAVGALTAAVPLAALQLATGALWSNTVLANVNPFDTGLFASVLGEWALLQAVPLALAGVWLLLARPWRQPTSRLLLLYWLASSWWVLAAGKIGANHNYWLEWAAATASLAGALVSRLPQLPRRSAWLVAAAATVGLLGLYLPWNAAAVPARADALRTELAAVQDRQQHQEFFELVARVRNQPGAVLAEPMDVVVLAGRPVLLEPLIESLLLPAGRWDPTDTVDQICRGQVRLLVLGYPLELGAQMGYADYPLWPPPVMAALEQVMQFEGTQAGRTLYVPRPGARCASTR